MKGKDTYKETRTIFFPNMVVTVHFPDITEDERKRRMKIIHDASAELLKSRK